MLATVLSVLMALLIFLPGAAFPQNYGRTFDHHLLADQMRAVRSGLSVKGQPEDLLVQWSAMGVLSLVKDCLDKGITPNAADKEGFSALMCASDGGYERIVVLLLQKGANVNAKSRAGATALLLAAVGGRLATAKLLMEKGADLNARDAAGVTPLMAAARTGRPDVVKLLLEKGADVNAQDNRKNTALDWAEMAGHDNVISLLKKGALRDRQPSREDSVDRKLVPKRVN